MQLSFASTPPEYVGVFVDAALKSVFILLLCCGVVCCMRRSSAAARHLVWFLAVAGLPVLPLLSAALPEWNVLPRWITIQNPEPLESAQTAMAQATQAVKRLDPQAAEPVPPLSDPSEVHAVELSPDSFPISTLPTELPAKATQANPPPPPVLAAPRLAVWHWVLYIWIGGTLLALLPATLGQVSLWRIEARSRRERASWWMELLRRLIDSLRFRRRVVLLKTHHRRMPMTWGVLRPKLLLPEESDEWTDERRRVVLLHELAHAKRWDYLTNLVTQLACALYWFNPLVWIAARRTIIERERACDDIVLRHGAKPADYAEQILHIAAGLRVERFATFGGIAMARQSSLEGRVRAILDSRRNRAALTRLIVLGALCALAGVVLPIAMMRAAPAETGAAERETRRQSVEHLPAERADQVVSPPLERTVTLNAQQMPLKDALAEVCRQAHVPLDLDVEAFELEGLTVDRPVTALIVDEPLESAVEVLLDRLPYDYWIFQSLRGGRLVVSSHRMEQERIRRALPDWLQPLFNKGFSARLDADRNVTSINAGANADDAFLAKLTTLPALRELDIEMTKEITPAGLAHLAESPALEKLHLYHVNENGARLGDEALRVAARIKTLRDLSVAECGVTDDGVRALEGMTQLEALSLSGNELTDAAMKSLDGLTNLQRLSLAQTPWIHSRMQITDAGVKQLSRLTKLRELFVGNLAISDDALSLPLLARITRYGSEPEAATNNAHASPEILNEPGWGEAVEGFRVRLRAPEPIVRAGKLPRLRVDIASNGPRDFQCHTNGLSWQLDVDGVPYVSDIGWGVLTKVLPERPFTNLPLVLTAAWRTADTNELVHRFGGGGVFFSEGFERKPLRLSPGKHILRLTVVGNPWYGMASRPVFAVSNPIEIEIAPGENPETAVGFEWRATMVRKYLPGYSLQVRRDATVPPAEILITPSGEEINLDEARHWDSVPSIVPPPESDTRGQESYAYGRNRHLSALAPRLNLKVETAQEAEEIARMILGLFKRWLSFENWTLMAERLKHGWRVTPRFVGPSAHVHRQGPLELILENGVLVDVWEWSSGYRALGLSLRGTFKNAIADESGWGEPVEGLSVRLRADKEIYYLASDIPLFRLGMRNLGNETFSVPGSQESGELEFNGVWYSWSNSFWVPKITLPAGRQVDDIAVATGTTFWTNGSARLMTTPGRHRIRFAVSSSRGRGGSNQVIRAVSNPVEVEFRMGVAPGNAPATNRGEGVNPSETSRPPETETNSQSTMLSVAHSDNPSSLTADTAVARIFTGRVIDVETRQAIPQFTVTPGSLWVASDILPWRTPEAIQQTNGIFHITAREGDAFKIDAPGYMPEMVYQTTLLTNTFVELHRGEFITGHVLSADGRPLEGVPVVLHVARTRITLNGTALATSPLAEWVHLFGSTGSTLQTNPVAMTDARGEFRLLAGAGRNALIAASKEGFASVKLDRHEHSKTIQLEPWARLVGTLQNGNLPIPGESVGILVRNREPKMNGIPEGGVRQFGRLLSDVDLALQWAGRRSATRGHLPVTDTDDLRVIAYTTNAEVRVAESFPVELRIVNTTSNTAAIYVMTCSWFADWVTTEPLIDWERWACRGNYPKLVEIAPGESYPMVLNVFATARPPGGKLTFSLGFVQASAAPDFGLSVFWSNDLTVTVLNRSGRGEL